MAPTELLAEQHFQTLKRLFAEEGGPSVALLTSSVAGETRSRLLEDLARQQLDVVIGTHALIEEGVDFARSEEHTSALQSLMRISYAVFCLKKTQTKQKH